VDSIVFLVDEVFDLVGRAGVLVSGRPECGDIVAGQTLSEFASGGLVHVLGIEFPARPGAEKSRVTILVERSSVAMGLVRGVTLVS
jgi:hypothetical protein